MIAGYSADNEAQAAEEARLKHAIEVHGLKAYDCPVCGGLLPAGCTACDGQGIVFASERPERCDDPDCPVDPSVLHRKAEGRS